MSATGNDAGFTLAEVLVTLAIAALVAASLVSFWPRQQGARYAVQAAAQTLAADLRSARGRAIAENRRIDVEIKEDVNGYALSGSFRKLPKEISSSAKPSVIVFYPDGTTAGGQVELADGEARTTINIARLSGRISVH